MTCNCPEIY